MFDQAPPSNFAAEESVIASLLVDDTLINRVAGVLSPDDFLREQHRWTYEACRALWQRDEAINQVTVSDELARNGHLEEVGGLTFLSDLILNLPTPIGAMAYVAIVKRDAIYRQMLGIATRISEIAYEAAPDLEGSIAKAETLLLALRSERKTTDWKHLRSFLEGYLDGAESTAQEPRARQVTGIRTGLTQLDALMEGLKAGNLIIVAARTGFGKTSLMLNFARNAAMTQRARVAVFSLEMEGGELVDRLVSAETRIIIRRIREWDLTEDEEQRVMYAMGHLQQADILFDHCPGIHVGELQNKAKKLAETQGVDLIIVDYVQLLSAGLPRGNNNRVGELTHITKELKTLASELGVPIVVGAQLSREPEKRADHRPMVSDLRESGSIEQDADVVLFIYREDHYTPRAEWEKTHLDRYTDSYPEGVAELIVAKHRSGPEGAVNVRFRSALTKFEDFDIPATNPVQMEAAF